MRETFPIVLQSAENIAPGVKHFIFTHEQADFSYVAGQFITIHIEKDEKILRRSYSIANPPEMNSHRIEFAAGYVDNGPASELLFQLKPGDTLNITAPFGRLILRDEVPGRYIFVSTSTGVTPFRAMLTELAQRLAENPKLEIVILEGVQTRETLLYSDDFEAFAKQHPRFQFYPCFSREAGEHAGYVQTRFPQLNLTPGQDVIYLCGNPGMVDDAFTWLKEHGFDVKDILREKYISSK